MKNIEDFIKENKRAFDIHEPSEGHADRFLDRLPLNRKRITLRIPTIAVAAVFTLLVTLSGLYVYDNWIVSPKALLPTLADAGIEYAEAEAYFVSTINSQKQMINELSVGNLLKERDLFEKEMLVMDSLFVQLQHDLQTNPNDSRVINAMINHYQMRIKVMQRIVNHLKGAKKINKTINDEKIYV